VCGFFFFCFLNNLSCVVDLAWEKNDEGADKSSGLIQFEWLKSDVKRTLDGSQMVVQSNVNYIS
jgi:hypothetical protein